MAFRALTAGTALSILLTGTLVTATWFAIGRPSLSEVRNRLDEKIPKISTSSKKSSDEGGRTEFESFRELFTYLQDQGKK